MTLLHKLNAFNSHWISRLFLGFLVGAVFIFLAFHHVSIPDIKQQLLHIAPLWALMALTSYSFAIAFRILRWQYIISQVKKITYTRVGVALVVGYAVNNIVPARLGELFRADFCKRRLNLPRVQALGSIVLERFADGVMVALLSLTGLAFLHTSNNYEHHLVVVFGFSAAAIFGGVGVILFFASHSRYHFLFARWTAIYKMLEKFKHSIEIIRSRKMVVVFALSIVVWFFDSGSLWALVRMVGVSLPLASMLLLVGVVSLSTLLPSPPGYVGTLQFAFVLVLSFFHYSASVGLVAATAQQVILIGYITLIGGFALLMSHFSSTFRSYLAA